MPNNWRERYYRYREFFLNISVFYKQRPDLKRYLELFLTLFTISAFSIFALRPTVITIIDLTKEIKAKQTTVNRLDEKIAALKNAQVTFFQKKSELALLDLAVPDNPKVEDFIKQTEAVVARNNLQLKSVSVDKTTLKGKPDPTQPELTNFLPYTFSIEGQFETLNQFLDSLSHMLRPSQISNVKFNQVELEGQSTLTLTVAGAAIYLPEGDNP